MAEQPETKQDGKPRRAAVGVEVTLFRWHLQLLDGWAAKEGVSRSEFVRQMIREHHYRQRPSPPST